MSSYENIGPDDLVDAAVDKENTYDPFGKDVAVAQLIVSMKIYDLLLAIFTDANVEAARTVAELHEQGIIVAAGPQFSHFLPPTA